MFILFLWIFFFLLSLWKSFYTQLKSRLPSVSVFILFFFACSWPWYETAHAILWSKRKTNEYDDDLHRTSKRDFPLMISFSFFVHFVRLRMMRRFFVEFINLNLWRLSWWELSVKYRKSEFKVYGKRKKFDIQNLIISVGWIKLKNLKQLQWKV